jgi:hypothetical protein
MTPVKKAKAKKTQVKKSLQVVPAQVPQAYATLVVGVSAVSQQADAVIPAVAAQDDEPAPVLNAADVGGVQFELSDIEVFFSSIEITRHHKLRNEKRSCFCLIKMQ